MINELSLCFARKECKQRRCTKTAPTSSDRMPPTTVGLQLHIKSSTGQILPRKWMNYIPFDVLCVWYIECVAVCVCLLYLAAPNRTTYRTLCYTCCSILCARKCYDIMAVFCGALTDTMECGGRALRNACRGELAQLSSPHRCCLRRAHNAVEIMPCHANVASPQRRREPRASAQSGGLGLCLHVMFATDPTPCVSFERVSFSIDSNKLVFPERTNLTSISPYIWFHN